MELFETDIEELYNEALRDHIRQHVYIPCLYSDIKNVSSLNLTKLFTSSSSVLSEKLKHVSAKRKDSGDFQSPYSGIQEVNYHKIVIERCNRNKACMCKPACQCERAEKVTNTEEHPKRDNVTEPLKEYIKPKNVQNQTSKSLIVNNVVQTEESKGDNTSNTSSSSSNSKTKKKAKSSNTYKGAHRHSHRSSSSSTSKELPLGEPLNFDETVQSLPETDDKYVYCNCCRIPNMSCSCQTNENQATVKNSSASKQPASKQASVQSEPQVKKELMKKKKSLDNESSDDSRQCCCNKKRCFCFKKQQKDDKEINRDNGDQGDSDNKEEAEKSIQTRNICCSDKCNQVSPSEHTINDNNTDLLENYEDLLTNVSGNSKRGKSSEKHCKCCKACPRNKIVLPPRSLASDQADTLKTLIKMEAKQNYRQVNIILQELSEQKNEIKKLLDLYQNLSKNVSGNKLDKPSAQGINKPRDYFDDNKYYPPKTHTVNICEGCGLHFYRDPQFETCKTEKTPFPGGDKVDSDQRTKLSVDTVDSDKHIRRVSRGKATAPSNAKTAKDQPNGNVTKISDTENILLPSTRYEGAGTIEEVSNLHRTESVLTLYMDDRSSPVSSKVPEVKINLETNTSTSEKGLDKCKSRSKAFINWCKKSFMSIKDKESKHVRECNKYLTEKLKQCRKENRGRPKKSIVAYFLQYFSTYST